MTEKSTRIDAPEPVAYSIERPGGLPGAEVLVKDLPTPAPDDGLRERAALALLAAIGTWIPDGGGSCLGHSNALKARAEWAWRQAAAFIAANGATHD